jgi:hypothetical protein
MPKELLVRGGSSQGVVVRKAGSISGFRRMYSIRCATE